MGRKKKSGELVVQNDGAEGTNKSNNVKYITHVSNRFVALEDGNNCKVSEDNFKMLNSGQMDQSKELGEVKHKLDQLHLEQVFFDDLIHRKSRPKRDIQKPARYK